MKHIYLIILASTILITAFVTDAYGQTATTTVTYSGFQACGGCTVCGADYWCTNTPGSYCGDTPPCQSKTFFDPVPAGHVVTSVTINYYTASCEGASFVASINSFSVPMAWDGASGCLCDDLPCMMTTSVSANYPCGMPGYNYGGNNTFNLCSSGPMCINRAVLIFTYVDPDVITPSITASGPLSFCAGGSVVLDAGSGYPSYSWNTGATSQTITATTAGTYSVTVSSSTGCTTGSSSVNVSIAPFVTPTFTQLGPYCMGASPGALPTTSTNGITGSWSPATISTAAVGNTVYTFTPNAGQCASNTTMTVTVNASPTPTFNALGPYCTGQAPGTLPTTSTNGVTGTWSPATINTSTPGTTTYTFTPTAGQCASTATMNITTRQNPVPTATIHGNPSCSGSTDGSIVVSVTGGTTPYSFLWNTGAITQDLFNVGAGNYSLVVTDFYGCTGSTAATLSQPNPVVGSVVSVTPCVCNTLGSATVSASGGTGPYTFTWPASAGGVVGATANNLAAGNYTVSVVDQLGCSTTIPVSVGTSGSVGASLGTVNNITCFGQNNGSIALTITPGTAPYTINWGSGTASTASTSYTISNLSAGNYNITVSDLNGCSTTLNNITISEPPALSASVASINHVTCSGLSNGSASISVNGGTPGYTFVWNPAWVSGQNPTGLSAGNYSVTVSDSHSCTATQSFTINENSDIVVSVTTQNAACFGETGSATVQVVSGGTPPYSILWQDNSTQFTNNNIPAGTNFGYTVSDNLGCPYSSTVSITEPALLTSVVSGVDVTCGGGNNGSASVNVTGGGTPPYFYHWSNNSPNPMIGYLVAGTYYVTVTDYNGCTNTHSVTINEPPALSVTASSSPLVCGQNAGSATASASGGTPPYTYLWSNSFSGASVSNLLTGNYSVTATDQHGCTALAGTVVTLTGIINPTISQLQQISCFGSANGVLSASAADAQNPVSYHWSNNSIQQTISNLPAGSYTVTINDNWGCTGTASESITQPTEMVINSTVQNVHCRGGADGTINVSASGGISPYTYNWTTGSHQTFLQGLPGGTYTVTVTDAQNCQKTHTAFVGEPLMPVTIHALINHVSCYGGNDGSILMNATGGTVPFVYSCNNHGIPEGQSSVGSLSTGEYMLVVSDYYGCTDDTIVNIIEPAQITVSTVLSDPTCIGNNDGAIAIVAAGGTEPYRYLWETNTFNLPFFDGLGEGSYTFAVVDYNDCRVNVGPLILEDDPVSCIRIPDAFTPNADGVNDTWIIENIEMFPKARVQVFNRWGQELYNSDFREGDWDGVYNGKLMPTGVYLYVIELFNGTSPFTGTVTLVK
ncbi:MAG TPA: gliding motility-associated C-terminal domain-containing protein [Bacteroidales bacterium]|nr:gliding motility-associated C-terminal domain-containing protein [Bacteroidales bacterium]